MWWKVCLLLSYVSAIAYYQHIDRSCDDSSDVQASSRNVLLSHSACGLSRDVYVVVSLGWGAFYLTILPLQTS